MAALEVLETVARLPYFSYITVGRVASVARRSGWTWLNDLDVFEVPQFHGTFYMWAVVVDPWNPPCFQGIVFVYGDDG